MCKKKKIFSALLEAFSGFSEEVLTRTDLDEKLTDFVKKEDLENVKNGIVNTLSERFNNDVSDLEAKRAEFDRAKETALNEQRNALNAEKETALINLRGELEEAKNSALNEQRNALTLEKETALSNLRDELEEAKNSALNEQKNALNSEKETALNNLRGELEEAKNSALNEQKNALNTEKETALNNLRDELEEAKNSALNEQRNELNAKKETALNALRGELNKTGEKLSKWEEFAAIYETVRESMEACDTFKALINEKALNETSDYVRAIGESVDFLKAVHDAALKKKKETFELITPSEKAVYRALNACYQKIWNIDFDVFVQPGDKSIDAEFEKITFNKDTAVNMQDPRDRTCKFTQGVYVPRLKARNGNNYASAQVKAGNN